MDSVSEEAVKQEQDQQDTQEPASIYVRKAGSPRIRNPESGTRNEVISPDVPHSIPPWVPGESPGTQAESTRAVDEFYLPGAQQAADLARSSLEARWVVGVFVLTLLFYGLFLNRIILYSSPPTGDQPFYLMVTMSIVQDGDFNLTNNYANRDEDKFYSLAPHPTGFVGMSAPYPLPPHNGFTPARPPSEQYNFHWPGLSLLIAPAWVIGGLFGLWWPATVMFMCIIGALLATNIFLFAHEITGRVWVAGVVWAALAFSNPLMSYTYLIFTELTCGLLLLYSFRRLALGWGTNGPFRLLLIGLSIAFIPWVAWRCAPISATLGIYAAIQWWRWYRTPDAGRRTPDDRRPAVGGQGAGRVPIDLITRRAAAVVGRRSSVVD